LSAIFSGLPPAYLQFMEEHPNGLTVAFNAYEDENPDFDGRHWSLMGKAELTEAWEMNGVGTARNFECLRLYVQLQKEYGQGDFTSSNTGEVALTRVESGFVIGQENGDFLYLDRSDNYSVWIYYHDGGDVTRIADSFEKFIMG